MKGHPRDRTVYLKQAGKKIQKEKQKHVIAILYKPIGLIRGVIEPEQTRFRHTFRKDSEMQRVLDDFPRKAGVL